MPPSHHDNDPTGDACKMVNPKTKFSEFINALEFVGALFDDGDLDGHGGLQLRFRNGL
jgi:hypothetical protein